jgi:hypothetical protein
MAVEGDGARGGDTGERLARSLGLPHDGSANDGSSHNVWDALSVLAEEAPADLAEAIEEAYETASPEQRRQLSWTLRAMDDGRDAALLRLLERSDATDAEDLLRTAVWRQLRLDADVLRRFVDLLGVQGPVIDALGLSAEPDFAPLLGAALSDKRRAAAARALACLGDRRWTVHIAEQLGQVTGTDLVALTAALEVMGDPAAVPHLLRWLSKSKEPAGEVHHALVRLTGRDPLIPLYTTGKEFTKLVRRAWAGIDTDAQGRPDVRGLAVESPSRARFEVDEGGGRIRVDYDEPVPGSYWPRWRTSLFVDGQPLYAVGSICGTCETTLRLLGWPARPAAEHASRVRTALASVDRLSGEFLDTVRPLLAELKTGHYRVYLIDLAVERARTPERSWWVRRWEDRAAAGADLCSEPDATELPGPAGWPGTDHFQARERLGGTVPTYGVLLPSQPMDALDEATVAANTAAIRDGSRPAALALGWVEEKYVEAEHEERFLIGTVLDGHHKLAAYAELGIPARIVVVARLENNWREQGGWGAGLDEVLTPLTVADRP